MKRFIFIFFFLFNLVYAGGEQSKQLVTQHTAQTATTIDPANLTINVPVTTNVCNHLSADQSVEPHNIAFASSASQATTITQHWQQFNTYLSPLKDEINRLKSPINHVLNHWKKYSAGALYSSLFIFLIHANHHMNNLSSWAQWKRHITPQEMMRHPQSALAKDLLHAIQNNYINKTNPTDGITPLARFTIAIEKEQLMIKRYLKITKWLSRLWLKKIFPYNEKKIEQAQMAQERLNFIHHLFISWAATQNIDHITKQ